MAKKGAGFSTEGLDLYRGGLTPFERAGRLALSREPKAFNYSELEETYPTRQVRPLIPEYIQRELDEQELERKAAEIEVRRREAQLNIYDSQLNQERERLRQVPLARQALSQLDPADPDFIVKLSDIQNKLPLASEDTQVSTYLINPLLRRHESMQRNNDIIQRGLSKQAEAAATVSEKDLQGAAMILRDKKLANAAKLGDVIAQTQIEAADKTYQQYRKQSQLAAQGLEMEGMQDLQSNEFASEEEAMASGLPSGTIVIINGRKARID